MESVMFGDGPFKFLGLVWHESKHGEIARRVFIRTVVAELRCNRKSQQILHNIRPLSHWKLISKFMLISSLCKKISSENSQLSKEINFKILFRNFKHVLFCEIPQRNFTNGAL